MTVSPGRPRRGEGRCHRDVGVDDDRFHVVPVDSDVEIAPDPTSSPDIGRHEEAIGVGFDQHPLNSVGGGTPAGETVVVMVVGVGDELSLPTDEPGRLAMADPLLDFRQRQTDLAQPGERVRHHDSIVHRGAE